MKPKRMRIIKLWIALAQAAVAAAACDSTKSADELTLGQSITILRELLVLAERSWPDNIATCPLGNGASVVFDDNRRQRGDTVWITNVATVTPKGCRLSANGDTLVLEGDSGIVFDLRGWHLYEDRVDSELDMAITGAVRWSNTRGASNSCEVDLYDGGRSPARGVRRDRRRPERPSMRSRHILPLLRDRFHPGGMSPRVAPVARPPAPWRLRAHPPAPGG